MADCKSNEYKNLNRNYNKSLTRQAIFINDYLKTKYHTIYVEAATFYNQLNENHPRKPDLRKSIEYRRWKNQIAVQNNTPTTPIPRQKTKNYVHMVHPNITLDSATSSHTSPSPIDLSAMEVTIDQIQLSAQNPPPVKNHADKRLNGMELQLSIPLLQNPKSTTKTRPEQVISTAYEETVISEGEQTIDPSILDTVSPETIQEIIRELQNDPGLSNIIEEIPDLTVDIPELDDLLVDLDLPELDDPLEDELNMTW